MHYLTIRPLLGSRDNCPLNAPNMYKFLEDGTVAVHDAGGFNFDLSRDIHTCSKCYGKAQWSNSANAQATKCLGLFELDDGTNRDHIFFDNGKMYVYDASRDPADKTASGVTHATDNVDLYTMIRWGSYIVFCDRAEHTPYKWKNGDANASKLIAAGTEFKFRVLLWFGNRIVGFYTTQTNGNVDIRYTDALPTIANAEFSAANQLYKHGHPITGAAPLGHNHCFVFAEDDIYRMDYNANWTPVFQILPVLHGWGSVNHHSILSDGVNLYFYDIKRGFCKFNGTSEPGVISQPIEDTISTIDASVANLMVGAYIPFRDEFVWTIPISGNSTPNKLIFYNRTTQQWRVEDKAARFVSAWRTFTNMTWNNLVIEADDVWPQQSSWSYYVSEAHKMVLANTDGQLYSYTSEADNGENYEGWFITPIIPFPRGGQKRIRFKRIEVGISEYSSANLDVWWRGGGTVGECANASWEFLGSISMASPAKSDLVFDRTEFYHQLKFGTDKKAEPFSIDHLKLGYYMGAGY